jgi:hypothetical protein
MQHCYLYEMRQKKWPKLGETVPYSVFHMSYNCMSEQECVNKFVYVPNHTL